MQTLIGQLSPEELQKLKSENKGNGFDVIVGDHIGYFRKPDLTDLNYAAANTDSDTPLEYNRIVMQECYLAGSKAVYEDDKLFISATKKMNKIIDGSKAKLSEW
jgi:hypothetical protein